MLLPHRGAMATFRLGAAICSLQLQALGQWPLQCPRATSFQIVSGMLTDSTTVPSAQQLLEEQTQSKELRVCRNNGGSAMHPSEASYPKCIHLCSVVFAK